MTSALIEASPSPRASRWTASVPPVRDCESFLSEEAYERLRAVRLLVVSDAISERNGVGSYHRDLTARLEPFLRSARLLGPDRSHRSARVRLPLPGDRTQHLELPSYSQLYQHVRKAGVVVIATGGPHGLVGALLARRRGIPVVSVHHTDFEALADLYWRRLVRRVNRAYLARSTRWLFRRSDVVLATSQAMLLGAARLGAAHTEWIGTPLAASFLEPIERPAAMPPQRFIFLGRLAAEKNIDEILAAAGELSSLRFSIVGDGPLRPAVEATARRLPNLELYPWQPRERVRQLLDASDALLLPSRIESFGTAALEAISRARLTVVSPRCGIFDWPELRSALCTIQGDLIQTLRSLQNVPPELLHAKIATGLGSAAELQQSTLDSWLRIIDRLVVAQRLVNEQSTAPAAPGVESRGWSV